MVSEWLILMVVCKFQMHSSHAHIQKNITMITMKQCCIYFIFNIMRNDFYFIKQLEKSSAIDPTNELN